MSQPDQGFDASRTAQAEQPPYRMGFPQGDPDAAGGPPPRGGIPAWLVALLASILVSVGVVLILYFALIKPNIKDEAKKEVDAVLTGQSSASTSSGQQPIVTTPLPATTPAASVGTGNALGDPANGRLTASVAQGQSTSAANPPASSIITVGNGSVLSITDVIFSNPNGDSGTVELRADGATLLSFQLANFRDQDYHFVAPLTFTAGRKLQLFVSCTQVGSGPPGGTVPSTCQESVFFAGFQKTAG